MKRKVLRNNGYRYTKVELIESKWVRQVIGKGRRKAAEWLLGESV